jgi:ribosomal protein L1
MAKKRSKRYMEAAKLVDPSKVYPLEEAVKVVKKFPSPKFDQTVTVSVRLGVDPKQSDQMVRGTCSLPHGSGKDVRVAVFAEGEAAEAARKAGAEFVGMDDLIRRVRDENFLDFDVAVATPAAMTDLPTSDHTPLTGSSSIWPATWRGSCMCHFMPTRLHASRRPNSPGSRREESCGAAQGRAESAPTLPSSRSMHALQ